MRDLVIAVANTRTATKYKNTRIKWEQLVKKLATTTRTPETYKEYLSLSKAKQGEIKDIGGFVGGELEGGRRSNKTVRYRDLITLDIDSIPKDIDVWFLFTQIFDCAGLVYSTHKHSHTANRLRLIIPLSRQVNSEEYEAIGRYIADAIGIDYFDDTTFQASRLMYWPSTSIDGEYLYETQTGEPLDVDSILATYADWKDITSWAYSSRINADSIKKTADTQADPLEKEGVIGAFCRAYSISEVIEKFLSDVYEPSDINGRYTYLKGSTAGGLVVYNDIFAYSHHSTDPAGGKLLNAFDLVRIHKFSDLDDNIKDNQSITTYPSFKEMNKLALDLPDVKRELATDLIATDVFEEVAEEDDWTVKLEFGGRGGNEILPSYNNIDLILSNDPVIKGLISYNEMSGRITFMEPAPWRKGSTVGEIWSDADDVGLELYIERTYSFSASKKIRDSVIAIQNKRRHHPIKMYLESLPKWDGTPRVDTLFSDYLGAEDNEYTRAVARKTLAAAVKRIYHPGTKWDYMTTFTGPQGGGKSTLIQKLGKEWYSDSIAMVEGKAGMEQLEGVWIGEMAELTATKRADVEAVKQFISKTSDDYRGAYQRHKVNRPRQCVLFGTTNNPEFLKDTSGNRRFLVIAIKGFKAAKYNIFKDLNVDQIWAEVLTFYNDEPLHFTQEIEEIAESIQKEYLEESPMAGEIREYLDRLLPTNWEDMSIDDRRAFIHGDMFGGAPVGTVVRDRVCIQEIWRELYKGDPKSLDRMRAREIGDVLRTTPGWEPVSTIRIGSIYGRQKGFKRIIDWEQVNEEND